MKQFRWWAFWRRVQYSLVLLVLLVGLGAGVKLVFFPTQFSCFDMTQNGGERGIDCGGACVRVCTADVLPPITQWAESFMIAPGQYNAVAYLENKNETLGVRELRYTFTLYAGETVVAERTGITVLPPNSVYPIFEGRIFTDGAVVTDTKLTLEPAQVWQPASAGREQFRTANISLLSADVRPRLEAAIENTALTAADRVEVVATLFNDAGEPLTASQTFIERIEPRTTQNIVFTWPQSIARTVRSCIIPTDVMLAIDLSGSMNNDGGTPPQPVTDALAAASSFVRAAKPTDNIGVVTYATAASLVAPLGNTHEETATQIQALTIAPRDETGFTNTKAALEAAAAELASARHNEDARRVLILLTDGLPTAAGNTSDPVAEAVAAAQQLTQSGVTVYAIGLGQGVNQSFITALASSEAEAYVAPNRGDLERIYTEITSSLCESGTARIDLVAKTATNFTPLQTGF